jgi:hypothetical protein
MKKLLRHAEERAVYFLLLCGLQLEKVDAPGDKQTDMKTICDSFKGHHIDRIVKIRTEYTI